MLRSTPEIGGPLTRTHKHGWPKALRALQQESLGGIGLKGATAPLQGMSCTSDEKNVLEQGLLWTCDTNVTMIRKNPSKDIVL